MKRQLTREEVFDKWWVANFARHVDAANPETKAYARAAFYRGCALGRYRALLPAKR